MGLFDDLIPQQPVTQAAPTGALATPAPSRGLFDDLIPAAPPAAALQTSTPPRPTDPPPPPPAPQMGLVERIFRTPQRIAGAIQDNVITPTVEAVTGANETAELRRANPNMPLATGAPLGQRAYASFMNTPDAMNRYLNTTFGPEGQGWYRLADQFGNKTERVVVRTPQGERIFNPPGLDWGDVAGMAGGVPDFAGGVIGGAAGLPAFVAGPAVGIGTSAATSAIGAQAVGETIGRLFPENRAAEPELGQVAARAGKEALIDTVLGAVTGGLARGGMAVANKLRAPFADSASQPMATEFRAATDRLRQQGYDIAPLPSESGAGGFIPRMEGFLEKLPGSSERMRAYREGGDQAIARFQRDIGGEVDPNEAGRRAVSEIQTQRQNLIIDREQALEQADRRIARNETDLVERQGPLLGPEAAGRQTRAGVENARQNFRDEAERLYGAVRAAPGGTGPIVDVAPVREQVRLIREALPPTKEGGPSDQFAPDGLTRLLAGVDGVADRMTLDQARQMRTIVNDAINDRNIMPGVPERYLSQLSRSLTQAIEGSVDAVPDPALREALSKANTFYRENVDQFSRRGVAEMFRQPTQPGFVEDNQVVGRMISGAGKPGVIRDMRETIGPNSPQWSATRRQAMEDILGSGRNETLYGRKVVNVDGLVARLNQADDETLREMFGVADAQQLRSLAADISNRTKYLDADALSPQGNANILQQLRAAAAADDQIARDYRSNVVAPFLRGEDGAAAKMKPEELVPYLYRKASPDEIRNIVGRLPPEMRANVEKAAVSDIIENAISKGQGDIDAVRRLITGSANPASSQGIAEVLGAGRDGASRAQSERISALLSPESRQALSDLALITAKRQERDATTSAIGGLAAGAAVTNLLSNPATGLQAAAVSRGLAQIITNPKVREWLTNTRQFSMSPQTMAQMPNIGVTLTDVVTGALGENQDVEAAMAYLRQGRSQLNEQGQRVIQPPNGNTSWEQFFRERASGNR